KTRCTTLAGRRWHKRLAQPLCSRRKSRIPPRSTPPCTCASRSFSTRSVPSPPKPTGNSSRNFWRSLMSELEPTQQQRDIIAGLTKTLNPFDPAQSPYADGPPPQPPAGRRKNPRALIVAASRIKTDPSQVRQKDRDPSSPRIQELASSIKQFGLQ